METNKINIISNNSLQLSVSMQLLMYVGLLPDRLRFPLLTQIFRNGNQVAVKVHEGQLVEDKVAPASFIDTKVAVKKMDVTKYWLTLFKVLTLVLSILIIYYK